MDQDYERDAHFEEPLNRYSPDDFGPRLQFARKVYGIVTVQLLLSILVSLITMNTSFGQFQVENFGYLLASICIPIVCFMMISLCGNFVRQVATNYIMLSIFTICMAYTVSAIIAMTYTPGSINYFFVSVCMTTVTTAALTIYTSLLKSDFTTWKAFQFCCIVDVVCFVILALFANLDIVWLVVLAVILLIFSFYLVFDLRYTMEGKRAKLTIDDHLVVAMTIYYDIFIPVLIIFEIISWLSCKERRHRSSHWNWI